MKKNYLKKRSLFISISFLFLLTYSNQSYASKVDASKFGFNATDATTAIKTAIAQRADTVVIPNMGVDWIITPIFCTVSNQTIIFEKGVVVAAKKGAFLSAYEHLFKIENMLNISFIGYGATLKMQKADYISLPQGGGGMRNAIDIFGSSGTKILGLTIKDTGGDAVMVYFSNNTLLKDLVCDNNMRTSIAMDNFKNATIENCVLINTSKGDPACEIDWEPDYPSYSNENGKMINSYIENGQGGGVIFSFWKLNATSSLVSIEYKHCFISSSGSGGGSLRLGIIPDGVKGTISIEDCIGESTSPWGALMIWGKSASSFITKFTNCLWQNGNPAIGFLGRNIPVQGGLQFVNCAINSRDNTSSIRCNYTRGTYGIANITGNIKVNCPYGVISNMPSGTNVTVQLTANKSNPPVLASVTPAKGKPVKVTYFTAGDAMNISATAYAPDIGTANGAGITKVDFALRRGDVSVASYSDVSAPYAWPVTTLAKCPRGVYMIRITAYSNDGSYTAAVVPIYIFSTVDGAGPYISGSGSELNHETINFMPKNEFLVRKTSHGFMVYSPFALDGKIMISDLSGRQVTMAQTAKGKSWNNMGAQNKLSNNVYFIQVTDSKGNNSIVKKAMMAR
jgi:hypothetical protein